MSEHVKSYLRWLLGAEGAPKYNAEEYDLKTLTAAGISLFTAALDRYFPEEVPTPAEAAALVTKVRSMSAQPETLNPVLAEQVILNAYADDDLMADVPAVEVARVENILAYGIRRELSIKDGPELEAFLDEVIEIMNDPANT
ncbi:hypothetical protein [Kineosporia babensis]|uniref:Uncharacterized protein n=1 Tax=Kineosporia babensis TaxID=499548 RepID=A0A9X1NFP1_9ACTN|nr:hypothetical protein [Kineosporia babensis]MCD5312724.1 hypothetical protein [Kineosporia babensis]